MRLTLIVPFSAVVVLGASLAFLGSRDSRRMPQFANGSDVLSVALGDARTTLSRALIHKADSYFHGGIDMDGGEAQEGLCLCDHAHEEHHHHGDSEHHEHADHEDHDHDAGAPAHAVDPWHWINARIRAPQVEKHLDGAKAVELMPWLWGSVRADPNNIDAWTAAWYTAAHTMRDGALAQRILDEAKLKNPDSAELYFTQGRFLYKMGKGDIPAALAAFEQARQLLLKSCGGDSAQLSEDDQRLYRFIEAYVHKISEKEILP